MKIDVDLYEKVQYYSIWELKNKEKICYRMECQKLFQSTLPGFKTLTKRSEWNVRNCFNQLYQDSKPWQNIQNGKSDPYSKKMIRIHNPDKIGIVTNIKHKSCLFYFCVQYLLKNIFVQ